MLALLQHIATVRYRPKQNTVPLSCQWDSGGGEENT